MKYYKISEKYLFQLLRDSKTIRGFDIDSETRLELHRVEGNEYMFQTFVEVAILGTIMNRKMIQCFLMTNLLKLSSL